MGASTDAAAAPPAGEVPRQLGRYEVLGELARGGMASVHLGRVIAAGGFERIVAIKTCHAHLASDPEFVSMFFDEARIAASIHHPNVVATLDVGNEGQVLYQVMAYVEGERFFDLMKQTRTAGMIPLPIVARIVVDALHGLHAAHELVDASGLPLDVVHRDISPQNIMVGTDGIARIMDFGIARAAARSTVTEKGVLKGKFAYMAPEQLLGQPVDRRCDLFAAGIVLWEAIVGRRLFAGDSQGETLHRVLHIPVEPPSKLRPEAAPLDAIVQRALARDADLRYATALEFAEAIETCGLELARAAGAVAAKVRTLGTSTTAERRRAFEKRRVDGTGPQAMLGTPTAQDGPVTVEAEPTSRERAPRAGTSRIAIAAAAMLALVIVIAGLAWAAGGSDGAPLIAEPSGPTAPASEPPAAVIPSEPIAPASAAVPTSAAVEPAPHTTPETDETTAAAATEAEPASGATASPEITPARARTSSRGERRAGRTKQGSAPERGGEYIPRSL